MTESREALAARVAAARDPQRLAALVEAHFEQMDATFFEYLTDQVDTERLVEIARLHLSVADPIHSEHLAQYEALLAAMDAGRLAEAIAELGARLTVDFVDTLLQSAESGMSSRTSPETSRGLLDLARAVIEAQTSQTFETAWPSWWLRDAAWHLYRRAPDAAAASIASGLAAEQKTPAPLVREGLLVNRALAAFLAGDHRVSITLGRAALAELTDPQLRCDARANLASAHGELGEVAAALAQLRGLLDEPIEDAARRARHHGAIAALYERLGRADDHKRHLQRSLELLEAPPPSGEARDWPSLATTWCNLTLLHLAEHGKLAKSNDERRRAKADAEAAYANFCRAADAIDPTSLAPTRARLEIALRTARGDRDGAQDLARQLVASPLVSGDDLERLILAGRVAEAVRVAGDLDDAERLFDGIRRRSDVAGERELLNGAWAGLARCAMARGDAETAAERFEVWFDTERDLRAHVPGDLHQLTWSTASGRPERATDAVRTARRLGDPRRLLAMIQRARGAGAAAGLDPVDFETLRGALPPDTALLEFFIGSGIAVAIAIRSDATDPIVVDLPLDAAGPARLQDAAAKLSQRLPAAPRCRYRDPFACLAPLGDALFGRLHPHLDGITELIIAPSGAAGLLPLHLLPVDGRRLIERFAIRSIPNGRLLLAPPRSRPARAMVLAAPRDAADPAGPLFIEEAAQVRARLARHDVALIDPPHDGVRAILESATTADILHIAAHGHFDDRRPDASGIELPVGGRAVPIRLERLAEAPLPLELVCLTGCDTGRVHALDGDEYLGLMTLLLRRRVRSAVLGLWPLVATSEATLRIVDDFYAGWLGAGLSKAEALRRAQLAAAATGAPIYEWGALALFGAG